MNFSHHPGFLLASVLCAWLLAESPVWSRIALLLSALSVPHASHAMSNEGKTPPQSSSNGSAEWKVSCTPVVYDGSGPASDLLPVSSRVRSSTLSRHGNDNCGFD